ncbi:zinc transport system ATP-binding protein [Salibacterium halotolerans]|uniref:Zinc transport system ATP-binding protein n=2 Tax=Salibacterium halotolerans TaxID=1884432 RepID=A0A1I5NIA1_9BACI|nr:zinc transport system ATP-binding protein [Salibacterium halotolerans]
MVDDRINTMINMNNIVFQRGHQTILSHVDLSVKKGEFLGLVGPNGSGKSTLIQIMLGLLEPDGGTVSLFEQPLEKFKHWERIGYVSQKAASVNLGFPATVYEVVSMGMFSKVGLFRFLNRHHKKKIDETLEQVGMLEYKHRNIGELSGGQQQRVFIARALVSEPEILILDEPTVGVDAATVQHFYQLLSRLNREQELTLLLVTHDVGVMTKYVSHVACLQQTLHFHGSAEDFEESDLTSMYGENIEILSHQHGGHS